MNIQAANHPDSRQAGYTLEIVSDSGVLTSITFLSVARGRLEVDNMITTSGSVPPFPVQVSRSAERLILLVDTRGGSALIRFNPGGLPGGPEFSANPSVRIVFDVVD